MQVWFEAMQGKDTRKVHMSPEDKRFEGMSNVNIWPSNHAYQVIVRSVLGRGRPVDVPAPCDTYVLPHIASGSLNGFYSPMIPKTDVARMAQPLM